MNRKFNNFYEKWIWKNMGILKLYFLNIENIGGVIGMSIALLAELVTLSISEDDSALLVLIRKEKWKVKKENQTWKDKAISLIQEKELE